jgi:hypothetical protein
VKLHAAAGGSSRSGSNAPNSSTPYSNIYDTINLTMLTAAAVLFTSHLSHVLLCCLPACLCLPACTHAALLLSKAYVIAMSCGVLEYLLESALLPAMKQLHAVSYSGLALLLLGEVIRKLAMVSSRHPLTVAHPNTAMCQSSSAWQAASKPAWLLCLEPWFH